MKKHLSIIAMAAMMAGMMVIAGCNCNQECEAPKCDEEKSPSCLTETTEAQPKAEEAPAKPAVEAQTPAVAVEEKKAEAPPQEVAAETREETPEAIPSLSGKWVLVKLAGADKILTDSKEPNIDFRDAARISGYSGLNTIGGQYELGAGNKIKFDKMISTMKAGPEANMKFERCFNQALPKVESYKITDEKLYFYDAANNELMVLQK